MGEVNGENASEFQSHNFTPLHVFVQRFGIFSSRFLRLFSSFSFLAFSERPRIVQHIFLLRRNFHLVIECTSLRSDATFVANAGRIAKCSAESPLLNWKFVLACGTIENALRQPLKFVWARSVTLKKCEPCSVGVEMLCDNKKRKHRSEIKCFEAH